MAHKTSQWNLIKKKSYINISMSFITYKNSMGISWHSTKYYSGIPSTPISEIMTYCESFCFKT